MISLFQTTRGTSPQLFVDQTPGMYYYGRSGKVTVMVTRNVLYITSPIFESDTEVRFELPAHPDFYLKEISSEGDKTHLVTSKERDVSLVVGKNYQLQGICPIGAK